MEHVARGTADDRSLSALFSDATRESSELLRKEIELAKLELTETIAGIRTGLVSMAIALPMLFAGFLVLLFAAVVGLDRALNDPWLSAVIVGAVVSFLGLVALAVARRQVKRVGLTPRQSVESLRVDKQMLQRHVGSGGR